MQASSPTRVCNTAGLWFPIWPGAVPSSVGAGFTPPGDPRAARGPPRRPGTPAPPRGSRDDASIVPYRGCNNAGPQPSRLAQNAKFIRRGGIYPARGTPRRRGPGRYGIGPYAGLQYRRVVVSCLAGGLAIVRRGGIHPARGTPRRREVPGTMQASSPTGVAIPQGCAVSVSSCPAP